MADTVNNQKQNVMKKFENTVKKNKDISVY